MARPLVFIGVALAITLFLAWPARNLRPGVLGAESLPPDDPAVRAAQLGQGQLGFPARLPVLLVASGVDTPQRLAELGRRGGAAAQGQPRPGPVWAPSPLAPLHPRHAYAVLAIPPPAADNHA